MLFTKEKIFGMLDGDFDEEDITEELMAKAQQKTITVEDLVKCMVYTVQMIEITNGMSVDDAVAWIKETYDDNVEMIDILASVGVGMYANHDLLAIICQLTTQGHIGDSGEGEDEIKEKEKTVVDE